MSEKLTIVYTFENRYFALSIGQDNHGVDVSIDIARSGSLEDIPTDIGNQIKVALNSFAQDFSHKDPTSLFNKILDKMGIASWKDLFKKSKCFHIIEENNKSIRIIPTIKKKAGGGYFEENQGCEEICTNDPDDLGKTFLKVVANTE